MQKILEHLRLLKPEISLGLNSIAFILGLTYLFVGKMNTLWNTYGIIMMITYVINVLFAAEEKLEKGLSYLYLLLSFLWMLAVPLINTLVSINPMNVSSQSSISAIMLLSLFFLGGFIGVKGILRKRTKAEPAQKEESRVHQILINTTIIVLSLILYMGLYLAINLIRKEKFGIFEVISSQYALFYAISSLSIGVLIRKLLNREKYRIYDQIVLTVTIFEFMVFLLPLLYIPSTINKADIAFRQAFGDEYKEMQGYPSELFRGEPFFLPEYYFGTPSGNYHIQSDVLFYRGSNGKDKGLELFFDVYSPLTDGNKLPGEYSVLIRIHGGSWTGGDKGASNFAQMNKYFASRGYVVFDIQYGVNDLLSQIELKTVPNTLGGDYSIDDMVSHIGIFMDYLAMHADEYKANLNSVFISGGSAGGQLALAYGLTLSDRKDSSLINSGIKVKGLIPFYPANGLSIAFNIRGKEELMDPGLLVCKDSPPCLIYQGSHDGLVSEDIAENFRDAYLQAGNKQCAIIHMPFGGHISDIYFSGYYNQIFLYYMERFMYQYK